MPTQLVKPLFLVDAAPRSSASCHILMAQVNIRLPGRSWCVSISMSASANRQLISQCTWCQGSGPRLGCQRPCPSMLAQPLCVLLSCFLPSFISHCTITDCSNSSTLILQSGRKKRKETADSGQLPEVDVLLKQWGYLQNNSFQHVMGHVCWAISLICRAVCEKALVSLLLLLTLPLLTMFC